MKVLIAGDYSQKNRVNTFVREKKFSELFGDIKPIVEASDYSIVNFEFPIILSPNRAIPIKKCGPNLEGTLDAIDSLKYVGFKCCTLANNHILDQGHQCCLDTKSELEKAGIDTVGVGKDIDDASSILYRKIGSQILGIINCCEHEFSIATEKQAGANPLDPVSQFYQIQEAKSKADFVIVIIHGGHEHFQLPSLRMQKNYRFFIDAGADSVINHHQHCFSGYEIYHQKPIFYGLGNLCFDNHKKDSIWNHGYMVQLELEKKEISFSLYPYIQCSEKISVELLPDYSSFEEKINKLNNIISSSEKLRAELNTYYKSELNSIINSFEPYTNRYLNKLFQLGFLPSFFKGKRWLKTRNNIECESHLDKVLFALRNMDNYKN